MRSSGSGSIGQILVEQGVIDGAALADALTRQERRHPVASELYTLGYATERELVTALAVQTGWPAIVLDESTIRLDVLEHVTFEWASGYAALIVHEDAERIVVAAVRPEDAFQPVRELLAARGKDVELRIALEVTLARTIRVAFRRWKAGERYLGGPEATDPTSPRLAHVYPDNADDDHRRAQRALAEDASRSPADLPVDGRPSGSLQGVTGEWSATTLTTHPQFIQVDEESTLVIVHEIDQAAVVAEPPAARHALVVDPDPPGRIALVAELERLGFQCQAAATGTQAVELLSGPVFELVFADIATPELDGLRMCRAIKRSTRLAQSRVVVTTSVVDSGQVPDDVLAAHQVDGYLEKPLDLRRLHRLLRELSTEARPDHDGFLADALGRYHAGDIDGAIARLRGALEGDPGSTKLHFMLANMLQRASRWAEAIDEYEAVVELQPAYFPALTRLAYLYFRQGLHARAVETWRRALPVCEDPALRRNIELFMRKLVADISKAENG